MRQEPRQLRRARGHHAQRLRRRRWPTIAAFHNRRHVHCIAASHQTHVRTSKENQFDRPLRRQCVIIGASFECKAPTSARSHRRGRQSGGARDGAAHSVRRHHQIKVQIARCDRWIIERGDGHHGRRADLRTFIPTRSDKFHSASCVDHGACAACTVAQGCIERRARHDHARLTAERVRPYGVCIPGAGVQHAHLSRGACPCLLQRLPQAKFREPRRGAGHQAFAAALRPGQGLPLHQGHLPAMPCQDGRRNRPGWPPSYHAGSARNRGRVGVRHAVNDSRQALQLAVGPTIVSANNKYSESVMGGTCRSRS